MRVMHATRCVRMERRTRLLVHAWGCICAYCCFRTHQHAGKRRDHRLFTFVAFALLPPPFGEIILIVMMMMSMSNVTVMSMMMDNRCA